MNLKIENAVARKVFLGIEDHGFLTATITLDYDGASQSFGGYNLGYKEGSEYNKVCSLFIQETLKIFGVTEWNQIVGKPCRVKAEHSKIHAIGHFLENKWFEPAKDFY